MYLNPMSGLIEGFRAVFLGSALDIFGVSISCVAAILIFIVGIAIFERAERLFADVI